jgi:hypothetical protein
VAAAEVVAGAEVAGGGGEVVGAGDDAQPTKATVITITRARAVRMLLLFIAYSFLYLSVWKLSINPVR